MSNKAIFTEAQIKLFSTDPAALKQQQVKRFCPHCYNELNKEYGCELTELGMCDGSKFDDGLEFNAVLNIDLKRKQDDYNDLKFQIDAIHHIQATKP